MPITLSHPDGFSGYQLDEEGFIVIFELMIFINMMLKRIIKKATIE